MVPQQVPAHYAPQAPMAALTRNQAQGQLRLFPPITTRLQALNMRVFQVDPTVDVVQDAINYIKCLSISFYHLTVQNPELGYYNYTVDSDHSLRWALDAYKRLPEGISFYMSFACFYFLFPQSKHATDFQTTDLGLLQLPIMLAASRGFKPPQKKRRLL